MNVITSEQEKDLLNKLREDNDAAFRTLFSTYYKYLTAIAYRYLKDGEKAKDFAQEAFVVLWNHRKDLDIRLGLKPYLRQVVVNKCLNHLRREQRIDFSENSELPETATSIDATHHLEKEDLQKTIQQVVDNLPNRCRIIFCMSRYDEKSHKEISQALGISPKTVENQITIALKALRKVIYKTAPLVFILLNFF
ncbi:MAG: RNA polymerase sigma-70 factor [Saprospiraceae bacterium]